MDGLRKTGLDISVGCDGVLTVMIITRIVKVKTPSGLTSSVPFIHGENRDHLNFCKPH